jgi:uncharacterized protein YneF (UPF0154 family)
MELVLIGLVFALGIVIGMYTSSQIEKHIDKNVDND